MLPIEVMDKLNEGLKIQVNKMIQELEEQGIYQKEIPEELLVTLRKLKKGSCI